MRSSSTITAKAISTNAYPGVIGLIAQDVYKYNVLKLFCHALELPAEHFAGSAALCFAHQDNELSRIVLNDVLILL